MRVKVLKRFETGKRTEGIDDPRDPRHVVFTMHEVGSTPTVEKERGEMLIRKGYAEAVDEPKRSGAAGGNDGDKPTA